MYAASLEEMKDTLSMMYLPIEMVVAIKYAGTQLTQPAYKKFVQEVACEQALLSSAKIVKRK